MASQTTLARMTQAGVIPITTNAVLCEFQRTWNRPDAAEFAALYAELVPNYQAVIESYQKAQDVAAQPTEVNATVTATRDRPRRRSTGAAVQGVIMRHARQLVRRPCGTGDLFDRRCPGHAAGRSGGPDRAERQGHHADEARPEAQAFAVRGEKFVAVGGEEEVMRLRGDRTRVIDAGGRRVIPGLNDSHLHAVRGGRFYNLELRWDGVDSLERGLADDPRAGEAHAEGPVGARDRRLVAVSVQGEADADGRRAERGGAGHAGVRPLPLQPGAAEQGRRRGAGAHAARARRPRAGATSSSKAAARSCTPSRTRRSSTRRSPSSRSSRRRIRSTRRRHFYRELNRFGLTSAVDPGGGGHAYPADYEATRGARARSRVPAPHLELPLRAEGGDASCRTTRSGRPRRS